MAVTVTVNGIAQVVSEIGALPKNLERLAILRMSQVAYDSMQSGASRHSKKGDLFASIYNRQIPDGRQVGHDEQRAPHAKFILFGTKDHKVSPKDKKALRWASGGMFFFSKGHVVKGILADNYLERAADDAIRQFPAIIDQAIKES